MRYLYAYFFVLILISCKTKSELKTINNQPSQNLCPEDGTCTFEVFQNHALMVKYNNLGELYPTITEGNNFVFKFEYKRNKMANTMDGGYREEIFIELDPNNLELDPNNLKSQKVIFARWCYCKGQTGYYRINIGEMSVERLKGKTYRLNLTFKTEKVPQVINRITHVFSLE